MSDEEMVDLSKSKKYPNKESVANSKKLYLNVKTSDIHFSFDSIDGTVNCVAAH